MTYESVRQDLLEGTISSTDFLDRVVLALRQMSLPKGPSLARERSDLILVLETDARSWFDYQPKAALEQVDAVVREHLESCDLPLDESNCSDVTESRN